MKHQTRETYDTNEWINPEAKLSDIAFKLNFFFLLAKLYNKTFPAILDKHIILMCYEMIQATYLLEKARDKLLMGNPSLHLIITLNI